MKSNSDSTPLWRRLLPLGLIGVVAIIALVLDLPGYLDFDTVAMRFSDLEAWRDAHPVLSLAIGFLVYAAIVTLFLPLAWVMTVITGLTFGWAVGIALILPAAMLGATANYWTARTGLEELFRRRAGDKLNRLAAGFREDAASYLVFLRVSPFLPFSILNGVAAIVGVPFPVFFVTTLIGIVPGTVAHVFTGEALRSVVETRALACVGDIAPCGEPLSPTDFLTPEIIVASAFVGIAAILPVVIKRVRRHKSA